MSIVILRSTGPQNNPSHFTPQFCEKLKSEDPLAYETDVLGQFAQAGGYQYMGRAPEIAVDPGRTGPKHIWADATYVLSLDQAFERDECAIAVTTSQLGDPEGDALLRAPRITRLEEVHARKPDGSPRKMLQWVKTFCNKYSEYTVYADQFSGLALRELAEDVGIRLEIVHWTGSGDQSKAERFRAVRTEMFEGRFRIPDDHDLLRELRAVRSVPLPSGGERIEVPRTSRGHGDRVSAMVLGGSIALSRPAELPPSRMTHWEKLERARQLRELFAAVGG